MKKSISLVILAVLLIALSGTSQNLSFENENPESFKAFKSQLLSDENPMKGQNKFYKNANAPTADYGNAPEWDWAAKFDGSGSDIARDAVVDPDGNMYITGSFSGTMELAGTSKTSVGSRDLFITKLDADGNLLWFKQGSCGEFKTCEGYDIKLVNEKILITGYFDGPNLNIDDTSVDLIGLSDAYILQLSTTGTVEMLKNYGFEGLMYQGMALDQDNGQNIYLTGTTDGNTTLYHPSFLMKISAEGDVVWMQEHNIAFNDLAVSGDQLYVTGSAYMESYLDTILLDPTSYYADAFVAQANLNGQYTWAVLGNHPELPNGDSYYPRVEISGDGNIFIAGSFRRNVEFGEYLLTSTAYLDTFIAKISASGIVLWAKATSGSENYLDGFTTLSNGNICISGDMESSVMFDDILLENPNPKAGYYAAIYNSEGVAQNAFLLENSPTNLAALPGDGILQLGSNSLHVLLTKYNYSGNASMRLYSSGNSGSASLTGQEVDESGSLFSLCNFYGQIDYFGVNLITNKHSMVLARQKADGTPIWTNTIKGGRSWYDYTETTLKLDEEGGRLYLHGIFADTLIIDSQEFVNAQGGSFIACYNTDGMFEWAKELSHQVEVQSVDVDEIGDVYISSIFSGTIEIEGSSFTSRDMGDLLILKYSAQGSLLCTNHLETDAFFYSTGIAIAQGNEYYVTMEPAGDTIFFNNGSNTMTFTPNDGRIVVAKYDDCGNYLWAKSYGSSPVNFGGYYCWPTHSVTDTDGNLYLTGTHADSSFFDDVMLKSPYNRYSHFVAKIGIYGNTIWANSIQVHRWGSNYSEAEIDDEGNFYCMASMRDTVHFDELQIVPSGNRDSWIARYDNNGELNWVKTIDSFSGGALMYAMAVYDINNLFVGGLLNKDLNAGNLELYTPSSAGCVLHIGDSIEYASINENNLSEIFVVAYPNPATDLIYLDFKTPIKMVVIELMDINGRLIKTTTFANPSGTEKLDVSGLPRGVCLIKITADGQIATRKVMIQ